MRNSEENQNLREQLIAGLGQGRALLKEIAPESDMRTLKKFESTFETKIKDLYRDSRKLNIGVVGQIKAGKSTFLNTLLFEGQEILPKAATPKTATLTRIEYGEENTAEVEYYTLDEWKEQEGLAAQPIDDPVFHAAKELVEMARERELGGKLDVKRCLAMGTETVRFDSYDELVGWLNDYVGENGSHTPLVKSVSLRLRDERFRDYAIVDTPGLNDPIMSRTLRTKEFMEVCDVVFFLSMADHFLDSTDWSLLTQQLPQQGVKRLVLIGSRFDGVVRDILKKKPAKANPFAAAPAAGQGDPSHTDSVPEACRMAVDKLTREAEQKTAKRMKDLEAIGYGSSLTDVIKMCRRPIFFSSIACNMLSKPRGEYSGAEEGLYKKLSEFSRDVPTELARMGDIAPLKSILDEIGEEKDAILQSKSDTLMTDARINLRTLLNSFYEKTEGRLAVLKGNDKDTLLEKKQAVERQRSAIEAAVSDVFSSRFDTIKATQGQAIAELRSASQSAGQINEQTGTEQETRRRTVSASKWYKPWTWGKKTTESYTVTTTFSYLASSDAVDNLSRYAKESATQIERSFHDAVNLQEMRQQLCGVVVKNMALGDASFDANHFRKVVNELVDEIDFPRISLDWRAISGQCIAGFSGEVRGKEDMQRLRDALRDGVERIFQALTDQFEQASDGFLTSLRDISKRFQTDLLVKLNSEFETLEQELAQKEAEIAKLQNYQSKLEETKTILRV